MKNSFLSTLMLTAMLVVLCFVSNVSVSYAAPPEGSGIPFDGNTVYNVDAKKLNVDPQGFSVAAWVRVKNPTKTPGSMQAFFSLGDTIMDGFKLYANNRSPAFVRMQVEYAPKEKTAVGRSYQFAGAPLPEADQWTHYLGTYDGKKIVVYMNGEKKADREAVLKRDAFNSRLLTLGGVVAPGYNLTGAMDQIQIWNKKLSDEEATQVFDGKEPSEGLIASWNAASKKADRLVNAVSDGPDALLIGNQVKAAADLEKPAPLPLTIDGRPFESFDPQKTEFKYYLPYNAKGLPEVRADGGTVQISKEDSSATVFIKNSSGEEKTYKIVLEKLPELDLFFCIGQSNMAGRGPLKAELGDFKPLSDVYLFTSQGNWELAENPLNKYSSVRKPMNVQQMSPPYAFAKRVGRTTGRPIGIVMNPRGGTTIEEWTKGNKGEFNLYEEAMKRALDAKKWGTYKAILWHQGEGNSGRSAEYPEKLKRLVSDLRSDLGDSKLFFVAGEIAHWRQSSNGNDPNEPFNKMIRGITSFLDHSACVSAEDLAPLDYNWKDPHFDRESLLILGDRYGEAVLKNVYPANSTP